MRSFQRETFEVDGDSDVAPARVHPGDPNHVVVPVRWLRNQRDWMESPDHIIRLQDDVWLVGYSMGQLFGDMMHLGSADIKGRPCGRRSSSSWRTRRAGTSPHRHCTPSRTQTRSVCPRAR